MKKLAILFMLMMMAGQAWGTDYYVRPHVTDGDCSYPAAGGCDGLTYATAWEGFSGGDGTAVNWGTVDGADVATLYVAGTYSEHIHPQISGEAGHLITIKSYDANPGIIDLGGAGADYCVQLASQSYFVIDGLTLTGSVDYGIYVGSTDGNVEIKNCTIYSNGTTDDGANDDNIKIYNGSNYSVHHNTIYSGGTHGIYVQASGGNISTVTIYNNTVYDNYHSQIDLQGYNAGPYTVTGVTIYNNYIYATGTHEDPGGAEGIWISGPTDATSKVDGVDIYYNIINGTNGVGIYLNDYVYDVDIYNNTIYGGDSHAISCDYNEATTTNIKNNILSNNAFRGVLWTGNGNAPSITNNDIYGNGTDTVSDNLKPIDPSNVTGDPLFVSAGSNFRIRAGSPARDAGTDVTATTGTADFIGSVVPQNTTQDIGAYEYPTYYNSINQKIRKLLMGLGLNL
jgi:hypothetical protein